MSEPRTQLPALDFDALRDANGTRCRASFHPIDAWSPSDWGVAMAGEAGEACNLIKKLRRLTDGRQLANIPADGEQIVRAIGDELADVVIYADLLAARLGLSLGECVRRKFNVVSDRVGSEIKL